jgi:aminopeptidase YwaD
MRKYISFLLLFVLLAHISYAQDIKTGEKAVRYLASETLGGRFPGTAGDSLSLGFIQNEFQKYGVLPFDNNYIQTFRLTTEIRKGEKTCLKIDEATISDRDFQLLNFSGNASHRSNAIYLNNNTRIDTTQVKNAWVFYHYQTSPNEIPDYRALVSIANTLQQAKAGGIIFVATNHWGVNSEFYPFSYSRSMVSLNIPVLQLRQTVFNEMLLNSGISVEKLEPNMKIPIDVEALTEIVKLEKETGNVVGYVPVENSDEWLVLGAHYDHLGMGGYGSGSRVPEQHAVHYGADDNASGVAMVLMLAEYYAKHSPEINMLFVLFGAEEQGLVGSKYFVENSPVSLDKIRTMLNFDMVGRVKDKHLSISGTKSAVEYEGILNAFQNSPLKLSLSGGGYAGSDQASFISENIPVLFFNSGVHDDYHTPKDNIDAISFEGMELVGKLSVAIIDSISHPELVLSFQEDTEHQPARHSGGMKVSLGIMPDVTGRVENGLGIDGVRPGGPADVVGVKKGDVLKRVATYEINNIYDYMQVLSNFEKGQTVKLVLIRDEKQIELDITF